MKLILLACCFLLCHIVSAQQKYLTRSGTVNFEASVPSFEEVKAISTTTTAILNATNGEMAALVLVTGFRFKNALMEEHFNENYAETGKYPKATFKGKLVNWSKNLPKGTYLLNGQIEFHGVTQPLENVAVDITPLDGNLEISGNFIMLPKDFNIEIPSIVADKIANEVNVSFKFILLQND